MINKIYDCPCCNNKAFEDVGGFDVCEYCGWQDDPLQRIDPNDDMGANALCLSDYRIKWLQRKTPASDRVKVAV